MRSVWSRVSAGSRTLVGPSASRPARSRHDFTCAEATSSRCSAPRSAGPAIASGGTPPVGASRPTPPASAQRLGDPRHRAAAGSTRRRRGRSVRPSWPASSPASRRISVPALPTSIRPVRLRGPAQAEALDLDGEPHLAGLAPNAWRRAPRRPPACSACPASRGSGRSARSRCRSAPSRAARCEIDLSGGATTAPAQGAGRQRSSPLTTPTAGIGATVWPSPATISAARSASPRPPIHSEIAPVRWSAAGNRDMSSMLTPARPSASAISATVPGRFSTATRSSSSGRGGEVGLEHPAAVARGPRPATRRAPRRSPARISSAADPQPLRRGLDLGRDGLGVGAVDVGPDRRVGARRRGSRRESSGRPRGARCAADARERPRETSTLASTCGRWLIAAISAVVLGRVDGLRPGADARRSARAGGRRATPCERGLGVRYQRAPSKRSSREPSTPAVSAPASGWPPMKRSAPGALSTASSRARFVEPTSVTTVPGPEAASAVADELRQDADGSGAEDGLGPGDGLLGARGGASRAPSSIARSRVAASGSKPTTSAPRRRLRGEADRAADQPDAEDGDLHRSPADASRRARTAAARRSRTRSCSFQSMQASVIDGRRRARHPERS